MAQNRMRAAIATTFDTSTLDADYQLVGTLPANCSILRISNNSTAVIDISFDGTHLNDQILGTSALELYFQASNNPSFGVAQFPLGTPVYAKTASAEAGALVVACYYQSN